MKQMSNKVSEQIRIVADNYLFNGTAKRICAGAAIGIPLAIAGYKIFTGQAPHVQDIQSALSLFYGTDFIGDRVLNIVPGVSSYLSIFGYVTFDRDQSRDEKRFSELRNGQKLTKGLARKTYRGVTSE